MSKEFIYDFYCLKDVSIPEWGESFFWPVSPVETQTILLDFVDENKRLMNELGNSFEGDCLTIYSQTFNPYIRVANYLLVLRRLQEAGYRPLYSDKSTMMAYLLDGGPFPVPGESLGALAREHKTIRWVKDFLLSVRFNIRRGNWRIWNHFLQRASTYAMPEVNVMQIPSTKNETNWVRISSPEEWLSDLESTHVNIRTEQNLGDIAHKYHHFAIEYMRDRLGLDVPTSIADDLATYQTAYLGHIAKAYQCIRQQVARKRPEKLFVGTGKTYTKALSLAVREHGGKVRGHPHGYFICHSASHRPHVHEFSTVDEFAVYTQPLKQLFERNISEFKPPRGNDVSFLSQNSDAFIRFRNMYKDAPVPKKIKRVMILELQLWADDIRYEIPETMINYHFYYNLCKFLTDNGYEVIFKKRPKSWGWQGINIFKDMPGVKVVHGSLEDPEIMNMADAIIFQYGLSSTFIPAMCSNKTLIYVDAGWEDWYQDVYDLVKKRCHVLECSYDEANQQHFDKSHLLNILSQKPEEPNMEFFEKFLVPDA